MAPTLEPEPACASAIIGDRIPLLRRFAEAIADQGEQRGLIGPSEISRLWTRHLLNCGVVAPLLRPGLVGDVGSGAGLPGLVLAIARPDVSFVLIEPMERRVLWLREQSESLELENVSIIRGRAQDVELPQPLDQVTARAVSALSTLIPLTAPLVKNGGELVLLKGINAHKEIDGAAREIRRFRLAPPEIVLLGDGVLSEATRVVRATVG
ncbi:16S rRNA (guanine(527)-N(7))-methyltransferase RsmG [Rathayibacter toxicus]|uniref:Ribosomal RNA small subunit methyltransferase G n=1 Tax=Rathayibacter toxicus TaxID=145458 RepID=A0A0U1PT72_9MICO|nr:16S rRNA (guanine(527)-N(7))-methyltransferase RsmG [Rathayibacter toxicus]ALS57298.1 16S rRNA (guanine(527)-N(7))-methyltransferase RsmG [Rathayibacter toxicus]KKM45732.1 16S rRNA methyltransferase [Rathayibacter toxicus]PPG24827.1 16S rRNA (guanine(527)-N(7))-methyltransferase RsmG [Rathayibacter toxicus]PPG48282.1 16S rRNA (guanine(527)-N(7))-methyltransferase RsmG [Rathayibacter toxicus]PPH25578.1 16S rRNA (guanine(527)-N(7))-methyltransferase RsmG [Rathayibacter toxicus]